MPARGLPWGSVAFVHEVFPATEIGYGEARVGAPGEFRLDL